MTDLNNEDRLLNGALRDLIHSAADIGDRKDTAAAKSRDVEGIACDPWRMRLSADYKETLAFLNGTKRRARELKANIDRHIADYDGIND